MADTELKVRIDAELGNFASTLKKGEKELADFGTKVDSGLKRSAAQAAQTGAALAGGYTKGVNQAAFATTNLSRVLQDAPFGFVGIQNNLNPLLESFQRLKAETGSNASAMKAFGASLIGPAGVGLALAAISAALLFYQQYQQKANKETKVAIDANKELAESIKSLNQVEAEGRKNASQDISNLQSLYGATQNLNIPYAERLKIAKELIKDYPTYLEGLTAEELLAGKAAKAYESLTNALLAKGIVQAAEENRQKLINQQLNANVEKTKEQVKLNESLARATAPVSKTAAFGQEGQIAIANILQKEIEESQKKIEGYNKTIKTGQEDIKVLDSVTQDLIKTYGAFVAIGDKKSTKDNAKNLKTVSDVLKALNIDLKQVEASVDKTFGDKSKETVSAFAKAIDDLISIGVKPTDGIIKNLQEKLLDAKNVDVKDGAAKFAGIVVSSVGRAFDAAGGIIPKELTDVASERLTAPFQQLNDYIGVELFPKLQSGFENFFNDILEKGTFSFGSLGSAILKTFQSVLASEATKGILNLLNPAQTSLQSGKKGLFGLIGGALGSGGGATAAAGTAATGGLLLPILGGIAAGGLIASLFKKKTPAPTPSYATNTVTSSASSSAADFGSGRVIFEISGTNLIGVLNRAGAKLQRFGP